MRISFLCNDEQHPVNEHLASWIAANKDRYAIELVRNKSKLSGGQLLFLISCSEIINSRDRSAYEACLVLHASDLPEGRGWSPHVWDIVSGAEKITLSLLEAEDKVDSGRVWKKCIIPVPKHALWDEINALLFDAEIELINFAVIHFKTVQPADQDTNREPTYYPRRRPVDSQIYAESSIASQFDKIRVCDPNRFPAFFEMHGFKYKMIVEKIDE